MKLGKKLASGTEKRISVRVNSNRLARPTVIGIPHGFGKTWITNKGNYYRHCENSMTRRGIHVIDTIIHENVTVTDEEGNARHVKVALETPFDPDIDKKIITIHQLTDNALGPILLRELIKYTQSAHLAKKEDRVGYDPLGGAIVKDIIIGTGQRLILTLCSVLPSYVGKRIQARIKGVQGKIRNLIIDNSNSNPHIVCIDIGLHDFSDRGKFKGITLAIHFLAFAAICRLIASCNKKLPKEKQIDQKEIDQLPYQDNWFWNITAKILWEIMLPVFERYEQLHASNPEKE